jgi:predicted short-subunit dehydrogenase-like oxidoreductase (DUF2520 family)
MKIVFLGAGNLATNLAHSLYNHGHDISQVFSRTMQSASELAEKLQAQPIDNVQSIDKNADLYILALKDDVIARIVANLPESNGVFVHTAGSIPVNVFKGKVKNYGVFYPLQTFNKHRLLKFTEIPVFVEANSEKNVEFLEDLAHQISSEVYRADSNDRLAIHIAAVFACNFTNFMFAGADELLSKHNLPFHTLIPLINETITKIKNNKPKSVQTGPAVRRDYQTIRTHHNLLSDSGLWQKLYRFVTDMMIEYYNPDDEKR